MRTPGEAKTIEDLQTATGNEEKKQFLVLTENSLKRLPFEQLNKLFVYKNIGRISQWCCGFEHLETSEILLLGGTLNPSDFEDDLAGLKKRCPSWIQDDGNIKLPNYNGYFSRMDVKRSIGNLELDSLEKLEFKSRVLQVGNLISYFPQPEGGNAGGLIVGSEDTSGTEVSSPIVSTKYHFLSFWQAVHEYYQSSYNNLNTKCSFKTELKPQFENAPKMGIETKPKNVSVLWTVCVGIPKTQKNEKEFKLKNSEQSIKLFQGESGGYLGFSEEIFET